MVTPIPCRMACRRNTGTFFFLCSISPVAADIQTESISCPRSRTDCGVVACSPYSPSQLYRRKPHWDNWEDTSFRQAVLVLASHTAIGYCSRQPGIDSWMTQTFSNR